MQTLDASLLPAPAHNLSDARVRELALLADPQPGPCRVSSPVAEPQVTIKCLDRLGTDVHEAFAAPLAHHADQPAIEVNVIRLGVVGRPSHACHLAEASTARQEHADQGRVAPLIESLSFAGAQDARKLSVVEHRGSELGLLRLAHSRHRRLANLTLRDEPIEKRAKAREAIGSAARRQAAQLVLDEGLDMLAPNVGNVIRHATLGKEATELVKRIEVGALGMRAEVGCSDVSPEAGGVGEEVASG